MSFIAVAIGSALVGTAVSYSANKKARKQTEAAMRKQETAAEEAAKLKSTREDAGAKVKIGAAPGPTDTTVSSTKGRGKKRKNSGAVLGGVSASTLGGL